MLHNVGIFPSFSALQRAEIAEMSECGTSSPSVMTVSVLFNEPKLLKFRNRAGGANLERPVSVLFNEPKLLKCARRRRSRRCGRGFSALQRAEIAEIKVRVDRVAQQRRVSVLFNEPKLLKLKRLRKIAATKQVSVLFNEPKLLK